MGSDATVTRINEQLRITLQLLSTVKGRAQIDNDALALACRRLDGAMKKLEADGEDSMLEAACKALPPPPLVPRFVRETERATPMPRRVA